MTVASNPSKLCHHNHTWQTWSLGFVAIWWHKQSSEDTLIRVNTYSGDIYIEMPKHNSMKDTCCKKSLTFSSTLSDVILEFLVALGCFDVQEF